MEWFERTLFMMRTDTPPRAQNGNTLAERTRRTTTLASRSLDVAAKVINRLPIRGENSFTSKFAERRQNLDQIKGYVDIYGAYGKCEKRCMDRTLCLYGTLYH